MRRKHLLLVLSLTVAVMMVSADEASLIDFNLLKADIIADPLNKGRFLQNKATTVDFSNVAGASFTDEQKKAMRSSLAIEQWDVAISSSSWSVVNQTLTKAKEAQVAQSAKQFAGQTVLGFRVHFPTPHFNGYAIIKPPFTIPVWEAKASVDDQGNVTPNPPTSGANNDPNSKLTRFEGSFDANTKVKASFGLVKNVGAIKRIGVWVRGLNFPHALSIILEDQTGKQSTHFMGYMQFDGWRQMQWDNPQYIQDVRYRELRIFPLYPRSTPLVKLAGFLVQRDGENDGGDFVGYIKDARLTYDKAVLDYNADIDDEAVWGIVTDRENYLKKISNFGQQNVLRYEEQLKQDSSVGFSPSVGQAANPTATPAAGANAANNAATP